MAEPETRSLNRCTYTPIQNSAQVGDSRPGFRARQPFATLALLRTLFPDARAGQEVLRQLAKAGSPSEYASVLGRAWAGDTAGAIAQLSTMDNSGVVTFGHRALDAYGQLLDRTQQKLSRTPDEPAPAPRPAPPDGVRLEAEDGDEPTMLLTPLRAAAIVRPLATVSRQLEAVVRERRLVDYRRDILRTIDLLGLAEPLGFLHLERMQFTPVGYVRGELVYSLPLVPGETVRLSHREWSRTDTEFTSLVATSVETAREDAVSEKSELTESVTAQQQHTSAFTSSVTASGGFGPVNVSSSVGYNVANSDTNSRSATSRHAQEITRSASTRAKKEHKITFRLATATEVEDFAFREVANRTDAAVRWDYHRLMRKWRIDLYRYDVRLTYDVVVPEPGSYLLRKYLEIAAIEADLRRPFELRGAARLHFHGSPTEIAEHNWEELAAAYDVALNPPPQREVTAQAQADQVYAQELVGTDYLTISLPDGYRFTSLRLDLPRPVVKDTNNNVLGRIDPLRSVNAAMLRYGSNFNVYHWRYNYDWSEGAQPPEGTVLSIGLTGKGVPLPATVETWQQECYQRIVDAARTRFEAHRQTQTARRDQLVAELDREDALALRKMEREEIQKSVLRWVLGHHFTFYPQDLPDLGADDDGDLPYYSDETGRVVGRYLDPDRDGDVMARYAQEIRFLQHAIEWENVNYVLYPYFWTDPGRWDLKQALYHPDFEHRTFLRAGAARVVLTLRPSYEKAFLTFMETGRLDTLLGADHVYMTVADELKAYASTNDRYTSAANAENPLNLVDTWYEFTPTGALDVVSGSTLDG